MIGQKLGNWKAVSEPYRVGKHKKIDVECLCGNSGVLTRFFNSIKTKGGSCGCLRKAKVSEARRALAPQLEVGSVIGKMTVTAVYYVDGRRYVDYTCACGNTKNKAFSDNLTRGQQGCRCIVSEMTSERNYKHGLADTKVHIAWQSMRQRCSNPNTHSYSHYGGRGISVCKEWEDFETFHKDMGDLPFEGATIERKDVNKGYSKENCRWATKQEQTENRQNTVRVVHNGELVAARSLARSLGLNPNTVLQRLRRHVELHEAFEGKLKEKL